RAGMRWRFLNMRASQVRPQGRVVPRVIYGLTIKPTAKRAVTLLALLTLLSGIGAWATGDVALSSQRACRLCGLGNGRGVERALSEPLHTTHGALVDATGKAVHLAGVNWAGFETQSFAPYGLDVRNYQDMLNQMAALGFNTLRLPYSNQLFAPGSAPSGVNYTLNPDLRGLQGAALLDKIVAGAARAGLCVLLDQH